MNAKERRGKYGPKAQMAMLKDSMFKQDAPHIAKLLDIGTRDYYMIRAREALLCEDVTISEVIRYLLLAGLSHGTPRKED
jgi:hypothetical protein